MNKEQAYKEFKKIINDVNKEQEQITKNAKEEGKWKSGLDANNALFAESDKRAKEKIKLLKSMVEED